MGAIQEGYRCQIIEWARSTAPTAAITPLLAQLRWSSKAIHLALRESLTHHPELRNRAIDVGVGYHQAHLDKGGTSVVKLVADYYLPEVITVVGSTIAWRPLIDHASRALADTQTTHPELKYSHWRDQLIAYAPIEELRTMLTRWPDLPSPLAQARVRQADLSQATPLVTTGHPTRRHRA